MTTWNNRVVRFVDVIEVKRKSSMKLRRCITTRTTSLMHTVGHASALKLWSLCAKWLPDCTRHSITPC
jgi:hypothetical protein